MVIFQPEGNTFSLELDVLTLTADTNANVTFRKFGGSLRLSFYELDVEVKAVLENDGKVCVGVGGDGVLGGQDSCIVSLHAPVSAVIPALCLSLSLSTCGCWTPDPAAGYTRVNRFSKPMLYIGPLL